ncbi:MAG: prepilin peptidase [Proteobacteria bacterium]|jgi:leader peptidase (prepilin peptidase) / N-methyltransferase|nr:prepilin peptidase [Pseudomonadota bacterium]MDA0895731.1 prepilin peptidase [Pseudomonadota bacterium]MDA1243456.1 prepilin peptidase [Pseudomonadota bacterium]
MTFATTFATYPTLLYGSAALLGLLIGSFINVVIYRLPIMLERTWQEQISESRSELSSETFNLAVPRSRCPTCSAQLSAIENVPVLSYLALRGRCRHCKSAIPRRYPLVELGASLISVLIVMTFGYTLSALAYLIFAWCLLTLSLIDLNHYLLPDDITLPLLWLGLLVSATGLGLPEVSLSDSVVGAAAGYFSLWSLFWAFLFATGKEGLGYGDFKLLAALGAWLGWQALLPILLLSSLTGAVIGLALIAFGGRERGAPLPFGPFLAVAGFSMLVWGPKILAIYTDLFSGL